MSSPLVVKRCTAAVRKGGVDAQCGNTVTVSPHDRSPKCHLHGNHGGSEFDRRFNELHNGGKYCWALQPYPVQHGARVIGGSSKGLVLARRDLTRAIRATCPVPILPAMAGALALDAAETWTDYPEYRLTFRIWRMA